MLQAGRARDLPMVCANADLTVIHRGRRIICAGMLALRYEELGGRVSWHGKPFASVYEASLAMLGISDRRRVLMVGDSLRTDIAGARGAGIDALWIVGGLHAEELGVTPGTAPDAPTHRGRARRRGRITARGRARVLLVGSMIAAVQDRAL